MGNNDDFKRIGQGSLVHEQADEHNFYELQTKNEKLRRKIASLECMLLMKEERIEFLLDEFYLIADACSNDRLRKKMRRILETQERRGRRMEYRQGNMLASIFNDAFSEDMDGDRRYDDFGRGRFYGEYFRG